MLKILLITDKRAGHESVSKGLIKALNQKWEIETQEVYAKIRAKFLKKIATILLNRIALNKKNIQFFIKLFYRNFSMDLNKKYDLVISTGGDTAFLNILLSKYFNIPNIYCSSLRGLNHNLFSHILSLKDNNIINEIVVDFPPIHIELQKRELKGKWLAILIGGATKNYKFSNNEFTQIIQNCIILANKLGYKILLTTSRRTPPSVEKSIKELCDKNSKTIKKCILFNQKPQKVINYFLSNVDVIFCTEDSGSMITESILAKKRLYTIKSKNMNQNKAYNAFIQNIVKKKYAMSIFTDDIKKLTLTEKFNYIENLPSKKILEVLEKNIGNSK